MNLIEIERALRELRLSGIADTLSTRVMQAQSSGDATMATTILDRLMHRAAMLEFDGKSYRLKEAAARIALTPAVTS